MSGLVPLTWRVGVRNQFGWLTLPNSDRHLVEVRLFRHSDTRNECHLVDLHSGRWLIVAADSSSLFTALEPAAACGLVGIPAPQTDNTKEDPVRVDPFHVERHRSPVFRAICDLAYARLLPCGASLIADEAGHWVPGDFDKTYQDNPEQFATDVGLAISAGAEPHEAVRQELCADAGIDPDGPAAARLLLTTGWQAALRDLDAAIDAQQQLIDTDSVSDLQLLAAARAAEQTNDDTQLAFV